MTTAFSSIHTEDTLATANKSIKPAAIQATSAGKAIALIFEEEDLDVQLKGVYHDGTQWMTDSAFEIDTNLTILVDDPELKLMMDDNNNGDLLILMSDENEESQLVHVNISNEGENWYSNVLASTADDDNEEIINIEAKRTSDGRLHVFYLIHDFSESGVDKLYYASKNNNGSFTSPVEIVSAVESYAVAIDTSDSSLHVVYGNNDLAGELFYINSDHDTQAFSAAVGITGTSGQDEVLGLEFQGTKMVLISKSD